MTKKENYYSKQVYIDKSNEKKLKKFYKNYIFFWIVCCFLYSELYIGVLNFVSFVYIYKISKMHKGKLRIKVSKGAGGFFPSYLLLAALFVDVGVNFLNMSLDSYKKALKGSFVHERNLSSQERSLRDFSITTIRSYQMISTFASGVIIRFIDKEAKKKKIKNKYLESLKCKYKQRAGQKIKSKIDNKHIDIDKNIYSKEGFMVSFLTDLLEKIFDLFKFEFLWERIEVSSCKNI